MGENENKQRDEIFSKVVRAGKRTYFFDVKATRSDEYYLTITESKKRFNPEQGKFYYEKHKLFLYKEDYEKFSNGLKTVLDFIETGEIPIEELEEKINITDDKTDITETENTESTDSFSDINFEDLGNNQ